MLLIHAFSSVPRLFSVKQGIHGHSRTFASLVQFYGSVRELYLELHFNPYKMSLTMILNDIPCVKLSLKPLL